MRRTNISCKICGKFIYRPPAIIKRVKFVFCSVGCRNKHYNKFNLKKLSKNLLPKEKMKCIGCENLFSPKSFNQKRCSNCWTQYDYSKYKYDYSKYKSEYRIKNKERIRLVNNLWKERNKEHLKEYAREYRKKVGYTYKYNPEYYQKNKKKLDAQNRLWLEKNRDKARFYVARHRLRKRNNGDHSFAEWENLKAQYNWICLMCRRKEPEMKLTEDHIIPLSKGGSNNIENIQPLCKSCNSKKHTKTIKFPIQVLSTVNSA